MTTFLMATYKAVAFLLGLFVSFFLFVKVSIPLGLIAALALGFAAGWFEDRLHTYLLRRLA